MTKTDSRAAVWSFTPHAEALSLPAKSGQGCAAPTRHGIRVSRPAAFARTNEPLRMLPTARRDHDALSDAMDRYADGDTSAFDVLYDALAPRLRAMLRRKRCNPALTEDLIQQTFLRMHLARAHYRRGQEVVPWAFAIARRLLIDTWRHADVERRQQPQAELSPPPGPEDEVIAGETARALAHGLERLAPQHREAFDLVKFDGLSLEQTAQVLGTTVTAIKLRLHRAYQALRGATEAAND